MRITDHRSRIRERCSAGSRVLLANDSRAASVRFHCSARLRHSVSAVRSFSLGSPGLASLSRSAASAITNNSKSRPRSGSSSSGRCVTSASRTKRSICDRMLFASDGSVEVGSAMTTSVGFAPFYGAQQEEDRRPQRERLSSFLDQEECSDLAVGYILSGGYI